MLTTCFLLAGALVAAVPLSNDGWTFSPGAEFPGAVGRVEADGEVLRLHYDFTGGGAYVAAYREFEAAEVGYFSFLIRKASNVRLTFRVTDETGQSLQKTLSFASTPDEWQAVEVVNGGWNHGWGGANNGRVNGTIHSFGILVEGRELGPVTGSIELREVVMHEGAVAAAGAGWQTDYVATDFRAGWGAGGGSQLAEGRWTYQLRAGATEAYLANSISLFGEAQSVTLRARGGAPGQRVRLRLGSHFQSFERELGELTGGPVELTVPLPPAEGWSHSGGENDGVLRRPLRLTTLIVSGEPGDEVTLDDLALVIRTEVPASDSLVLIPESPREVDGRLSWRTELLNLAGEPQDVRANLQLGRWSGEPYGQQAFTLRLHPGQRVRLEANSEATPTMLRGQWTLAAADEANAAGGAARTRAEVNWVPPTPPAAPGTPAEPDSPWGMGVYLYRYPGNEAGLAEMDQAAALAAAAGVRWTREEFQWHRIEPREGEYDWTFYDAMVDTAGRHGLSIYGLLCYWTPWSASYTREGVDEYTRWVRAVVTRYRDRIKHWEIWNEPNIFFWSGPKELYPVMLAESYAAIKEVDPEARVLGISTAGIDLAFINQVMASGAPFDDLTVHPYRGALDEAAFVAELRAAAEAVEGRPVWITEMGWPTQYLGGVDETEQARLLARCYLSAVGSGAVTSMSWYNYRNDGVDPFYNETNFGVIRRDFSPKPAYQALRTVCTTLAGARDGAELDLGPGWLAYRYQTTAGAAVALWSQQTTLVRLAAAPGTEVVELMGERAPLTDRAYLLAANTPLILAGTDRVNVAAAGWSLEAPAAVRPGERVTVRLVGAEVPPQYVLSVRTQLPLADRGVDQDGRQLWFELPADTPAGRTPLSVEIQLPGETLLWPLELEVLPEVVRG
ncbi:MAG TPA: hypothetical protein DCZ72_04745 [Armatimonadetes bacterium]|nr:hypothetical protein [Armatimonadota bacterium]